MKRDEPLWTGGTAKARSSALGCAFTVLGACLVLVLSAIAISGLDPSFKLLGAALTIGMAGLVAVGILTGEDALR